MKKSGSRRGSRFRIEYRSNQSPQDKYELVKTLKDEGKESYHGR